MGMLERIAVKNETKARIKPLVFGDPVTNVCAGEGNPYRQGYFVRTGKDCVECTDKKGGFWWVGTEVIFAGHLEYEECEKLFKPIWEANYR